MADVYEKNLESKSSLTVNDYIRVVGSDNVSYKQLVSDVANKIITTYTGASLAGSNQSVKSALDSLNSNLNQYVRVISANGQTGTINANSTKEITINVSSLIPIGYTAEFAVVTYTGDDQFCIVKCVLNVETNIVSVSIRNTSSSADSGTVLIKVLAVRNI